MLWALYIVIAFVAISFMMVGYDMWASRHYHNKYQKWLADNAKHNQDKHYSQN